MTTSSTMTFEKGRGGAAHRLRAVGGPLAVAVATVVVVVTAPPASAWALCPNCLGQTRRLTPTLELLGLFLLVPFVVAYFVLRRIRRACRDVRLHHRGS